MSAVFGGSPVTRNRQFDPSQDNKKQNLRKLNPQAMSSPSALAGTHGTHAELTHGDNWQQIEGAVTTNILKDLTTTITLNEIRNVQKDEIRTIGGILNQTIIGSTIYTHIDTVDVNYLQVATEAYASMKQIFQPTALISYVRSHSTCGWYSGTYAWENWQASGDNVQLSIDNWQITGGLNFNVGPLLFDASGKDITAAKMRSSMKSIGTKMWSVFLDDGGPKANMSASTLNGGPEAGQDSIM
jgi:hypothetical protein